MGASPRRPGGVLITGVGGFVGRHLVAHLLASGDGPLSGLSRPEPDAREQEVEVHSVDLTDRPATRLLVHKVEPSLVYHLAAQASVADSHADPLGTLFNNIGAQVNLLETLAELPLKPRVLVVGSNEEYGQVRADELPVRESNELRPLNPYAVSKVAQDLLGYQYFQTHGLPVVRVRPFTHCGPGQDARFVTAAFARQVARIEVGLQEPIICVGNLEAQRDFTDVRDVVRGYRMVLLEGEPGEVYNLGSERANSIRSILDRLLELSSVPIRTELDPARVRPSEAPPQYCDSTKLRNRTGWRAAISLDQSLADILADWRLRVGHLGEAA